jgi:PKD repeat protein
MKYLWTRVRISPPSPATGFIPFTVGFDASGSTTSAVGASIVKYTWKFDTGDVIEVLGTPPIPVTTHTYGSAGTYLVKLTVEDSVGNIGYAFKSIIVTKP